MLGFLLAVAVAPACPLVPAQIGSPRRVNVGGENANGPNQSDGIAVAASPGRVVIAWAEQAGTSSATQDVYAAVSLDAGASWSAPSRVDLGDAPNASDSQRPDVAVTASGAIVVVFEDARDAGGAGTQDLFVNRSSDGVTWESSSRAVNALTAGSHTSSDVDRAAIAASGESVHVAWEEDLLGGPNGPEELWLASSHDGGKTFSAPWIVSGTGAADVDDPCIAVAGLDVLVVFVDDSAGEDDVWALVSDDGGQTFTRVSVDGGFARGASAPMLAREDALAAVLWTDLDPATPQEGLRTAISLDGGRTFGPAAVLTPTLEATSGASLLHATLAVSGGTVVVVHTDDAESVQSGGPSGSAGARAYAAVSHDGGASWAVEIPLSASFDDPVGRPSVAAAGARFVIAMECGDAGQNGVALVVSPDGGRAFSELVRVPGTGSDVDFDDAIEASFVAVEPASGTAVCAYWDRDADTNELYACTQGATPSLLRYCHALPNSSGAAATLGVRGEPFLDGGTLVLEVDGLPDTPGLFLSGNYVTEARFGGGYLCTNGAVRILPPPRWPVGGRVEHVVQMPGPGVWPGMRCLQYWFRETPSAPVRFSTSDAVAVWFQ